MWLAIFAGFFGGVFCFVGVLDFILILMRCLLLRFCGFGLDGVLMIVSGGCL